MSINCKICNEEFPRFIHWRHLKTHGYDSDSYKREFGPISDPTVYVMPEERKQRISASVVKYASAHSDIMKERTKKAIQTKKENGYDFGLPMRGKKQTEVSKQKSRETILATNAKRRERSNKSIIQKINDLNLTLINSISDITFSLTCNTCGTNFSFTKQYFQPSKFKQTICPTCYPRSKPVSKKEQELYDFIKKLCPTAIQSYRAQYHDKEIDIFIPELNIGIEFNGLYWHSEEVLLSNNRNKLVDRDKLIWAKKNNIRLIQIFEDEWDLSPQIVKSRLQNILGVSDIKVYARKCSLQKITGSAAAKFCNDNHIMGKGRSNACYGLYYDKNLVSVMTFSKSNLSRKIAGWELNRFCSKTGYSIVGGASKLFSAFIKEHSPASIVSYSDNRWSDGDVYEKLGFTKVHDGIPNYWYIKPNYPKGIHRFTLRKTKKDPDNITEYQLRANEGFSRIWDSGSSKWVWTTSNVQ